MKCLELASRFDTYGFSPYTVQTVAGQPLEVNIGANHLGVLVYMKNQKVHQIPWSVFYCLVGGRFRFV